MPTRTKEQRELIDSLPIKEPDAKCNARHGKGYCGMPSGFRTDHPGKGRCWLHGGSAGRPIVHGLYSEKLKSKLKDDYEKSITDPSLIDLYNELAFTKVMMSNFIERISERLEEGINIWVSYSEKGTPIVSPEAKVLIKMMDTISKLYSRIVDAENKSKNILNIKQVYYLLVQVKNVMNDTCGGCPVRKHVGAGMKEIKNVTYENIKEDE
jgi:hypothetical protein